MKSIKAYARFIFMIEIFLNTFFCEAQDFKLNEKLKNETVNQIALMLEEKYVLPEIGKKYAEQLKSKLKSGEYKKITNPDLLANKIISDLNEIQQDKHLEIRFNPDYIQRVKNRPSVSQEDQLKEEQEKILREHNRNYGFRELKILPGNIGYIRFDEFPSERAAETIISAFRFLQYTDAIMIDLRFNDGGNPEIVSFIAGYFFTDDYPTEFSSFYHRILDKKITNKTPLYLPGNRLTETDLFILVGPETFSAAEAFAYDFKHLNRAKIVGENTAGGAHVANSFIVNDYFIIQIPFARAISPVTNSNWESVGVEPDIKCESEKALQTAYQQALGKIIEDTNDEGYNNSLGYALIRDNNLEMAIYVFKKNVELHPDYANGYDSLGEAYMKDRQNDLAIKNYKKSLEINPENDNAKKMLEKLYSH